MKFLLVMSLSCIACASGDIEIINDTPNVAHLDDVESMALRVCSSCGGLRIRLIDLQDARPWGSEYVHGPGKTPEIHVIYMGCLCKSSLAHELIHWKLDQLTGDSDTTHSELDWALVPVINEEFAFACEYSKVEI